MKINNSHTESMLTNLFSIAFHMLYQCIPDMWKYILILSSQQIHYKLKETMSKRWKGKQTEQANTNGITSNNRWAKFARLSIIT